MKALKRIEFKKIVSVFSENSGYKLLLLSCIAGILFGSLAVSGTLSNSGLDNITDNYFALRTSSSFFVVLLKSFSSSFLLLFITFLLGNFNFGCFVVCFIPFFKGYGIGSALGYMFQGYGAKGLAYSSVVIIPAAVISALVIASAAYSSAQLSYTLFKKLLGKKVGKERFRLTFSEYCRKYIFYVLICLVSALLETVSNAVFSGLFDFS